MTNNPNDPRFQNVAKSALPSGDTKTVTIRIGGGSSGDSPGYVDPRFQGSGAGPARFGVAESEFSILKDILTQLQAIRALLETKNDVQ